MGKNRRSHRQQEPQSCKNPFHRSEPVVADSWLGREAHFFVNICNKKSRGYIPARASQVTCVSGPPDFSGVLGFPGSFERILCMSKRVLISLGLLGAAWIIPMRAEDYSKLNFNIGG